MAKQIFLSYSSRDQDKADMVREALEVAGMTCWIAPRDLSAGMQWGAGIVAAIEASACVVVVFSAAANTSPQVAREMELAVANRLPLVPIRVADDMPTDDMKYFLGVSHWFNAFAQPLETYLPDIVVAVRTVLKGQSSPWKTLHRRLPKTRAGQIALGAAAMLGVAMFLDVALQPANPMAGLKSPIAGRWEAQIADGRGGKAKCIMDVEKAGQVSFSDDCPLPVTGAKGYLATAKDGIWATGQFKPGDSGSLLLQGGTAHGFAAAFKRGLFGGLTTRDPQLGEVAWHGVGQGKPLTKAADKVLPAKAEWPLRDVPALAQRAKAYVRAKWRKDAQLMSIDIKLSEANNPALANLQTPSGGVDVSFRFYSPDTQELMNYTPASSSGDFFAFGVRDIRGQRPLPTDFLDLAAAVERLKAGGMRAKAIKEAQIQDWGFETTAGRTHMTGVEWLIDSQLDERFVVPAAK